MKVKNGFFGLGSAAVIITSWVALLAVNLHIELNWANPMLYGLFLLQVHAYTGVFITAHDAIHGTVTPNNPKLNYWIGFLCATLFAFNNFKTLSVKHHLHHRYAATNADPDYHDGNPSFWFWYYAFLKEYISWLQILLMALTYTALKLVFPYQNLIIFWMLPAILSTFQLFYFGTYLPHRGEHHNPPHNTRSQAINHVWAFVSCYFFGYHYEHHDKPYLPWWKLAKAREEN